MKYESGKPFVCAVIGSTKTPKPIDYVIPTEMENQKYLNLLGKKVLTQFEREVMERIRQREQDNINYT